MPNPLNEIFAEMDVEQKKNAVLRDIFAEMGKEQQEHRQKIQVKETPPPVAKNKRFFVQIPLPKTVDKTIGPALRGINRAAEFAQEALHLDPQLTERVYGGHTETGSPVANVAGEMGGQIAGTIPLMMGTGALTAGLLGAAGKAAPAVANILSKAPAAAKVVGRAAAPGATYWAAKEALSPEYAKPGLERLPEELAFWGGAGTAGKYAADALGVLPRMVSAPLVGATEAAGGGLAAYPFSEEKGPEYFKAMGPQAIAMGLLRTAGALGEKGMPARAIKEGIPPMKPPEAPSFVNVAPKGEAKPPVKEEVPPAKEAPPFLKEKVQGMAQREAIPPPEAGEVSPTQKADINAYIEREFLMPLRSKRMPRKGAAGVYKVREEVARTKRPFDIDTAAHELGHHLTKTLGLDPTGYPEIHKLGAQLYPDKPHLHGVEGIAEFFRRYFVNPARAQKEAPKFYADFTERLNREPELGKKITELQDLYQGWYKQDAVDYYKGLVVKEEPKAERGFLTKGQQAYTEWVDDLHPIYRAMEDLSGKLKSEMDVSMKENPYVLARLAKASSRAAEGLLTRASVGPNLKVNGKSYREILEPVRDRLDDFRAYIIAKRVLEREGLEKRSGFDPVKAQEVVNRLDSPEFQKAAEERQRYRNNLLDWLVDSGVFSGGQAEALKEMQKDHVPFYRYFGEGQSPVRGKGTGYTKASQPIKRMRDIEAKRGAEQPIIDPIESDIRDTFLFMRIAKQNYVMTALAKLAKSAEGQGWLVEEVPTPVEVNKVALARLADDLVKAGVPVEALEEADLSQMAVLFNARKFATGKEAAENIITVRDQGRVRFYQLHPELYKAVQGLNNYEANFLLTFLGRVTGVFKVGILSSPDFWVRNVARDTGNRLLVTKGSVWKIPMALIKGFYHAAKKTDKYVEAEVAGALQASQVSLSRERMQEYVKRLTGSKETKDFIKDIVTSPIRFISNLLELSDEASRMAEYLTTEGESKESKQWAAYHARESSLDYLRAGTRGREMNKATAFFNAGIQGPDKLAREFRRDPGKMLVRGALLGMLGAYTYFVNHKDKETSKRYDEEARWRKDLYWIFYRKDGTPVYLPKPFEGGIIFSSSVERTLDAIRKKDPQGFKDLATSTLEVMTPSIIPTAFMPTLESWANKSFFTGRPIVPMAEQRLPEQFQYGPQTSETAKAVGKILKVSPRKVESTVRGYTGTMGMHALDLVDVMAGKALEKKTAEQLIPGARAFTGEPLSSSASVDEFYNELGRLEKEDAAADKKLRKPLAGDEMMKFSRLKFFKKLIDPLRKQIQQIQANPNLNPMQRRGKIRELNKRIVNEARKALKREPLK